MSVSRPKQSRKLTGAAILVSRGMKVLQAAGSLSLSLGDRRAGEWVSVLPPWVFAVVSAPIGAVVGALTLRPRRAGVLAGMAGMVVAGALSGALSIAGVVFDPSTFRDPRWTVGLAAGAVVGCLVGWYVWDVARGAQPPAGEP